MIPLISSKIVILVISLLYFVQCRDNCSCYRQHLCQDYCETCKSSKTSVLPKNMFFKDLIFAPDHLGNCSQWFLEGYNISLIHEGKGSIHVTLLLSPFNQVKINYKVNLKVLDEKSSSFFTHSMKQIELEDNSESASVFHMEFHYLFSGTYFLEMINSNAGIGMRCQTQHFYVSTSYKIKKLSALQTYFYTSYLPQIQELKLISNFPNISTVHPPFATIIKLRSKINMSLKDCAGSGNEVTKYIMYGSNEGRVCGYMKVNESKGCCNNSGNQASLCQCHWDREELKCFFKNITNGNYCIVVEFMDNRCKSNTIWTEEGGCKWSASKNASGIVSPPIIIIKGHFSYWLLFSLTGFFIGVIIMLCIVFYRPKCVKKVTHHWNNYVPANLTTQSSESSAIPWIIHDEYDKLLASEILLLYPRDCEAFMKTMSAFRACLNSVNFKVYDPWDEEIYDSVVESHETWTLPFIKNKNIKIVIVLTECSKRFEKAYLENCSLSYCEPQLLDIIFYQSLSTIHLYFSKRFDSYQRIFVTRFDGSSLNFEFITPATVYSIPKNINLLIRDLSGNMKNLNYFYSQKLKTAFDEYKKFREAKSDHLVELLCSSKHHEMNLSAS